MSIDIKGPFIVTGASGQLGSQVIENLLAQGAEPLVAITRTPEKLAALLGRGVDVRAGDFNDPAALGAAFAGGGRLLIISTDDLEPGKRLAAHRNAIAAAQDAGVSHIVYTSLTNPDESSPITFAAALHLFATTSMGILLATIAGSMPQFAMLLLLVLLPLEILSGGVTQRESMPEVVQHIMLAAPNTHFIALSQGVLFRGAGIGMVWPQLLALAAVGAVLFTLALRRFRKFLG